MCWVPDLTWFDARNSCGGTTISGPGGGYVGSVFMFDASNRLVGAETWTDIPGPDDCQNNNKYGKQCESIGTLEQNPCPQDPDAGVGDP